MKSTTETGSDMKAKASGAPKNAQDIIDNAMKDVPEVLKKATDLGKDFLNNVSGSKDKAIEAAAESLQFLDKTMKSRPWAFVGGAAILGFAIGYFVARGKKAAAPIISDAKDRIDKFKDHVGQNINRVGEHLQ